MNEEEKILTNRIVSCIILHQYMSAPERKVQSGIIGHDPGINYCMITTREQAHVMQHFGRKLAFEVDVVVLATSDQPYTYRNFDSQTNKTTEHHGIVRDGNMYIWVRSPRRSLSEFNQVVRTAFASNPDEVDTFIAEDVRRYQEKSRKKS